MYVYPSELLTRKNSCLQTDKGGVRDVVISSIQSNHLEVATHDLTHVESIVGGLTNETRGWTRAGLLLQIIFEGKEVKRYMCVLLELHGKPHVLKEWGHNSEISR